MDQFPTETAGLPAARHSDVVELAEGERFELTTGETVDILLDVTNVGRWMAHCHIAEHHESGMMFSFEVTA